MHSIESMTREEIENWMVEIIDECEAKILALASGNAEILESRDFLEGRMYCAIEIMDIVNGDL